MAAQSSRRTKHRAELYRFEVTPEYRSSRAPLWRLNSTGLTARELIQAALDELDATNRDESIRLRHMEPLADLGDDEAGAVLGRGRSGVSSEIWETDRLALRRQPEHVETVSAVVICSLRDHYTGLVAMHVPHNMPYKSVLADWLESQFAAHGLDLRMWPVTDYGAWAEAISNGYVKKMRLRARDEASVPLSTSYAQEMGGDLGGVDLVFRARRGGFLRPLPLLRYMQRQGAADRTAVLEFQELLFEEADVTVKPPGGMERTYLLDGGEGGSPLSQYLDVNLDDSRHLGHPREAEESDDQRERRNVAIQGIVTQIREMIEQAPRTST